ncbi:MAG: CoA pyrophosphatase [Pseudomonadota bacterium]
MGSSPPRISDPRAVPVTGTDAHLPAVAAERLSEHAVRERFAAPGAFQPELAGDGRILVQREPVPAAVLVPLVRRPEGLQVLLTQRTAHLRDHAGQVSFPGGRCEPHDTDAAATALRETEEEVGLDRHHVEVVGSLPQYTTVTGFVVTPVVGLVTPGFVVAPDSFEVAEVFEVPLSFLMTPAHHRRHVLHWEGVQRQFLSMPWAGRGADGRPREYFIWGATAAMLRNLYRFLAADARA